MTSSPPLPLTNIGAFCSLVFPIYNKNHSIKDFLQTFKKNWGGQGPMTPLPLTNMSAFFKLVFPF